MKKVCKFTVFALLAAAVAAAGVLVWRSTQPVEDPWAEEYWEDAEGCCDEDCKCCEGECKCCEEPACECEK